MVAVLGHKAYGVRSPVADYSAPCRILPRLSWRQKVLPPSPFQSRSSANRAQLLITSSAATYASDLATYSLPHHSTVGHSTAAPWFQSAINEVVKHLDSAPFLQLVRFVGGTNSLAPPKLSSFGVPESVVGAPELWASIAEAVTADTADVVILVRRVDPHSTATAAATPNENSSFSLPRLGSSEIKAHVEDACRRLVSTGVGKRILQGKVGECCDSNEQHSGSSSGGANARQTAGAAAGIVPFGARSTSPTPARSAVKVKALPSPGAAASAPLSGYWGVVVQSKHHTGAEGCYLLRAVRQVCPETPGSDAVSGCSCTHYSLTRVCQGEHVERQFVNSWLV